jgi:hypothetical protein
MTPDAVRAALAVMTPVEVAAAIGGQVQEVHEPLTICCPTCQEPPGNRCRRYDGTAAQPHPARRRQSKGVRVIGPFIAAISEVTR